MSADSSADPSSCEIKIGVIVNLDGSSEKIGHGVLCSAQHILEKRRQALRAHGLDVKLLWENDHGQATYASRAVEKYLDAGCVAVIGPCDSMSMKEIVDNSRFDPVPKLCTFATATGLARSGGNGFFRFTHNDEQRADYLIAKLAELSPAPETVIVYTLAGAPDSYANGLKEDVTRALEKRLIQFEHRKFSVSQRLVQFATPKARGAAVVICSPSKQAVKLIGGLRNRQHRGSIFAFGSNTNFLVREANGTIVVADLDRHDPNPKASELLKDFSIAFPKVTEPSISTICAMESLVDILLKRPTDQWCDTRVARQTIGGLLRKGKARGPFGPVGFTSEGELLGHATISLLEVVSNQRNPQFRLLDTCRVPPVTLPHPLRQLISPLLLMGAIIIGLTTILLLGSTEQMWPAIGWVGGIFGIVQSAIWAWERVHPAQS